MGIATLLLLSAAGCLAAGVPAPPPASKPALVTRQASSEPLELRVGASTLVPGTQTTITFTRVREDSRCPIGVTCIWEGDAIVVLQVAKAGEPAVDVELHANAAFRREETLGTLTVSLLELAPVPRADEPIAEGAYIATLQISAK